MSSPFSAPPTLLGIRLSDTYTTARHVLGSVVVGQDGATYRYVEAAEALTAYKPVDFDADFAASETDNGDLILGVPQVAIASGSFGWIVIKGPCTLMVTGSMSAGVVGRLSAVGGLGNTPPSDHEGVAGITFADEAATPAGVAAYLV